MAKRVSLVLNDTEQHQKWSNFQIEKGYGNFSQMVRNVVEKNIDQDKEPIEKSIEPLKNTIDSLYRLTEKTNDEIEILRMRLGNNAGKSEIHKAAQNILPLILQNEKTLSEIKGTLNYNSDIIEGAITLMIDLGLIGTKRKNLEKDDSGGIK